MKTSLWVLSAITTPHGGLHLCNCHQRPGRVQLATRGVALSTDGIAKCGSQSPCGESGTFDVRGAEKQAVLNTKTQPPVDQRGASEEHDVFDRVEAQRPAPPKKRGVDTQRCAASGLVKPLSLCVRLLDRHSHLVWPNA